MKRSLGLTAFLGVACTSAPSGGVDAGAAGREPMVPVTIHTEAGSVVFQAEIADSPAERSRGLMFREGLAPRAAMLFLFPEERQLSFWMRNTLIPLDMIFIRADRTILGIVENAEPRTDTSRSVPGKSQFVLEIAGGLSAELGIRADHLVGFMAPVPDR